MSPRLFNVVLGAWLFISAFAWPHSPIQQTNSWMVGAACVLTGFLSLSVSPLRFLNAALAVWLFVSAFTLPTLSQGTVWNNALVALGMFLFSVLPLAPVGPLLRPRPPQPA